MYLVQVNFYLYRVLGNIDNPRQEALMHSCIGYYNGNQKICHKRVNRLMHACPTWDRSSQRPPQYPYQSCRQLQRKCRGFCLFYLRQQAISVYELNWPQMSKPFFSSTKYLLVPLWPMSASSILLVSLKTIQWGLSSLTLCAKQENGVTFYCFVGILKVRKFQPHF